MEKGTDVAAKQFHLSNLLLYLSLIGLAVMLIVGKKYIPTAENFYTGFKAIAEVMPLEYNAVSYNLVKNSVKHRDKEIQIFIGCSSNNIDALDCTTMELYVAYLLLKPYRENIDKYKDWRICFYTYYTDTPEIIPEEDAVTPYSITVEQFMTLNMLDEEINSIKDFKIVTMSDADDDILSITNNYNLTTN